ncbi:hypothetical protein BGZ49_005271 [Haplosporangium sp. Z 27]|nr:hypothetical protein BGZ49_005271 [Haplosporangium sp. Z 27]
MDQDLLPFRSTDSGESSHSNFYNNETRTHYPLTGIPPIKPSYISQASQEPVTTDRPQKLLIILDLNGTLFYRSAKRGHTIIRRPHLSYFLDFLFTNFRVMVWSSARAESVDRMLKAGFGSKEELLDRIWDRSHFNLRDLDFKRNVLTLKNLEFVWDQIEYDRQYATDEELLEGNKYGMHYDQTNTVLIDDSVHKSQLQPYNCVLLTEFDLKLSQAGTDTELLKVMEYLTRLAVQQNVSAYIKRNPFEKAAETDVNLQSYPKKQRKALRKARFMQEMLTKRVFTSSNEVVKEDMNTMDVEKIEEGTSNTLPLDNVPSSIPTDTSSSTPTDTPSSTPINTPSTAPKSLSKTAKRKKQKARRALKKAQQARQVASLHQQ